MKHPRVDQPSRHVEKGIALEVDHELTEPLVPADEATWRAHHAAILRDPDQFCAGAVYLSMALRIQELESSLSPVQEEATPTNNAIVEAKNDIVALLVGLAPYALDYGDDLWTGVQRERHRDDILALASALPALLEASRERDAFCEEAAINHRRVKRQGKELAELHAIIASHLQTIRALRQQGIDKDAHLAGSISERETLTAQNAELRESWYAGFFSHAKSTEEPEPIAENEIFTIGANALAVKNGRDWPVVSPVETATTLLRLIGEIRRCEERSTHHALLLHESRAAVARLTTENTEAIRSRDVEWERAKVARAEVATLRDEIDEMKKAVTDGAETIEKQNQQHDMAADRHRLDTQLLGQAFGDVGELREQTRRLTREKAQLSTQLQQSQHFREQAIHDIEALPPACELISLVRMNDQAISKRAVLSILRGSNG